MMRCIRKLLCVFMAVCFVLGLCSAGAFAEAEQDSEMIVTAEAPAEDPVVEEPAAEDSAAEEPAAEDPIVEEPVSVYTASFVCDDGVAGISVFYTKDYTVPSEENAVSANARSSDTGEADISGDGQVNFAVIPADGYSVKSITVTGPYKNLKGPADTGADNTYRITKIKGDLTVTVTTEQTVEEPVEADPFSYSLTKEGIVGSDGEEIGKSLKIKSAGIYTLTGVELEDYVNARVQIQAEDVTLVLRDVRMSYTNGAVINAKYDTIICVEGDNYLTRVIDNEADPTDDGGKVIKGESSEIGKSVSITLIGGGTLNIDAPKKGIGVDVYFGEGDAFNEEITEATLDAAVNLNGPTVNITSVNEAIEGNVINFNAGGGKLVSTGNDGVNVSTDGDDQDEDDLDGDGNTREFLYPNLVRNLDYTQLSININGGTWIVISNDDGLDSNGCVSVNGGDMQVYSSSRADNNAVDYGSENRGAFTVTGGKLLAVGMHGFQRQETPDGHFVIFYDQNVQEGSPIIISDAQGNVIYSATGVKYANCVLYCSDEIVEEETYTLKVGDEESTAVAGESQASGEPTGEPSGEPSGDPSADPDGEPKVWISTRSQKARVTGNTEGLYVRYAMSIEVGGVSGLLVMQREIENGIVEFRAPEIPGVKVLGISVALVKTIDEILSPTPDPVASAFYAFP